MRAGEHIAEFEIDGAPIWPVDDARLEPVFLAGEPDAAEIDEPAPPPRQRASALSPLGSLCVHLATLLCLLGWGEAPAETPDALPVQLVLEAPAAGPSPDEAEAAPPAPDSAAMSKIAAEAPRAAPETAPTPPAPPHPVQVAVAVPRSKPVPPELKPQQTAADAQPAPAAAAGQPSAEETQSDYLAHLVALTRGHLDLLPPTFLAGRRGHTILSVAVRDDGTIGRIAIKRSSGYPDIDSRIEQLVVAVGRFPPPPDSFRRPSAELDFNLTFPDALPQ